LISVGAEREAVGGANGERNPEAEQLPQQIRQCWCGLYPGAVAGHNAARYDRQRPSG
jgi:hypothetical protein